MAITYTRPSRARPRSPPLRTKLGEAVSGVGFAAAVAELAAQGEHGAELRARS